jgi:hypothetical protein
MFNGVSVSGTSRKQIQVGAGSVVTTGYVAASTYVSGTAANNTDYFILTTGFGIIGSNAADLQSGTMILHNISGNIWVSNHSMYMTAGTLGTAAGAGNISLGGTLDRVRITTVNGTDAFDAGSVNIIYEG